uniref:Putative Outer membrane chaperone Skp (OmpH) n=1 Tax=Magnetococcus massalia (strain MO-1) TaxID=451514 RepID=A0A1S7LGH3_MAGMO|nr:Putative Outer membrane chaperone Skp (OmpH) [Candidatus Magnetococcus massalia]
MWKRWTAPVLMLATLLMFAAPTQGVAADGLKDKVAFVNMQRAISSSTAARAARSILKQKLAKRQKDVDAMQANLKRMQEALKKQSRLLSAEALAEKRASWNRRFREYQRLVEDHTRAQESENVRLTRRITAAVREVIEDIARERGFVLVLDKGQVIFSAPDIDITEVVLGRLNSRTKDWFKE